MTKQLTWVPIQRCRGKMYKIERGTRCFAAIAFCNAPFFISITLYSYTTPPPPPLAIPLSTTAIPIRSRVSSSSLFTIPRRRTTPIFRRRLHGSRISVWYIGKMHTKSAQSSFRDRTHEFQSIAERLKKTGPAPNGQSSSSSRSEEQRSAIANQSEFNRRASKIGFGIHQTSQKLAKLAKCKQINRF